MNEQTLWYIKHQMPISKYIYMVFTCVGHIVHGFTMVCVQKIHVNYSKCLCVHAGITTNVKK